jgi:hypothetical protein
MRRANRARSDHVDLARGRGRFVQRADKPVRGSDGAGREPAVRALNDLMQRTRVPIIIAIFLAGAGAYVGMDRLRERDTDRPGPHTIHYESGGAFGSWHARPYSGLWRTADADLDTGALVTTDPDGEHRGTLTGAEIGELRTLTALSCRQSWDENDNCTDVAFKLSIRDGACAVDVAGSCPAHEELVHALAPIAWGRME